MASPGYPRISTLRKFRNSAESGRASPSRAGEVQRGTREQTRSRQVNALTDLPPVRLHGDPLEGKDPTVMGYRNPSATGTDIPCRFRQIVFTHPYPDEGIPPVREGFNPVSRSR
jgi:hypothetical protein